MPTTAPSGPVSPPRWEQWFPWIVLLRAIKPATSIPGLVLSTLAVGLTLLLHSLIQGPVETLPSRPDGTLGLPESMVCLSMYAPVQSADFSLGQVSASIRRGLWPTGLDQIKALGMTSAIGKPFLRLFGTWLIWIVPAGWMIRQAASDYANHPRASSFAALKITLKRTPAMLAAPSIIVLGIAIVAALTVALRSIGSGGDEPSMLTNALQTVATPIWLLTSFMLLSLAVSLPLMWSAAVLEPQADAFDAFSRGLEYLWRRPLHATFYMAIAFLLSYLVSNVAAMGLENAFAFVDLSSDRVSVAWTAPKAVMYCVALALMFNLFWSSVAAIYLLLRRDANHQSIDEFWEPSASTEPPLPTIPASGAALKVVDSE
jgi:hypothetical protein